MQHTLSDLSKEDIGKLEDEGIRLTPHDIIHIAALGAVIDNPVVRKDLSRGRPVPIGGTFLWPMTLAANAWWDDVGSKIKSRRIRAFALAYAMANGGDALPEDQSETVKAVKSWQRKLHCTLGGLMQAITDVQSQERDFLSVNVSKDDRATPGEISTLLAGMTGNPHVWEYQCSMSYTCGVLKTIVAQNAAEGRSPKEDLRIQAVKALGLAVERIRNRHKREMAEAE